jgi:glycosyltransferase involved in cell wall biosynthesis
MEHKTKINHQELNKPATPLVSIIVITYNSAKYVLETLESAKVQTYLNIEVIVSDDCSMDDTVSVCSKWLEDNKGRFARTQVLTNEENTGIAENCNRGIKAGKGNWIKLIAGDDLLLPNCLCDFIEVAQKETDKYIFFSNIKILKSNMISDLLIDSRLKRSENINIQTRLLLRNIKPSITSIFFSKDFFIKTCGFNAKYPMYEDYPFLVTASLKGIKFCYLDQFTAIYRDHPDSIMSKLRNGITRTSFDRKKFYKEVIYLNQIKRGMIIYFYRDFLMNLFSTIDKNSLSYKTVRVLKVFDYFYLKRKLAFFTSFIR